MILKSATKPEEPVDEYAATVVLDEPAMTENTAAEPTRDTLTGDDVQDIEAALRRNPQR